MKQVQLFFKVKEVPAVPTNGRADMLAQAMRFINDPNVEIIEIANVEDVTVVPVKKNPKD